VRTPWYRPLTLKINASIRREVQQLDALSPTALRLELGAGEGYRVSEHGQVYFMADGIVRLAGASSLAAGPVAGWVWQPEGSGVPRSIRGRSGMRQAAEKFLAVSRIRRMAWDVFDNQNNIRLNVTRQWTDNGGNAADSYTDIQLAYFHYL